MHCGHSPPGVPWSYVIFLSSEKTLSFSLFFFLEKVNKPFLLKKMQAIAKAQRMKCLKTPSIIQKYPLAFHYHYFVQALWVYVCVYVHVNAYVYTPVYVHILSMYADMCMYTHTHTHIPYMTDF